MKTYLRHRTTNVIDIKELVTIEYLDFEGKYRNYSESHDFYELCYVENGEITLHLADKVVSLKTGDSLLIPQNTKHSYSSENGNLSRVFVICFECQSHMLKLLSGNIISVGENEKYCISKIIKESKNTFTINEKEHLELVTSPSFGGQQAIILQLEYLLICILRKHLSEKETEVVILSEDKFYHDLVNIIISHLRDNVCKKLSLNDICERFNYSKSFICKIFKEQTGYSIITYINRLKIEEAKKLLTTTGMTAAEISESLGFSEAKYFGSVFKKHLGVSPLAYREQIRHCK